MPKIKEAPSLDEAELRAAALEAEVDPRTLRRFLGGQTVRGAYAARRMRAALAKRGVTR